MPFEITTTRSFAAAHQLRFPDGSIEPVHGHNWRVKVTVASAQLDAIGTVMDFHDLERLVDAVVAPMHNRHLNELEPFTRELNPSAENVALHVARSLVGLPAGVRLARVEVWETDENSAAYLL
jgi:6-pyruvoyltetrahydropterin/6-carboxytetrahydropterin synthase